MFVNRKSELRYLEQKYNTRGAQFVVLYGRRRVGKTELVKEFLKTKPGIYYLAEKLPEKLQLEKLSEKVIEFFREDVIKRFEDWEMLFKYLARKKERFVLVIDEFPYLIAKDPDFLTTFQKGWDEYLKDSGVFLILTGSSVSIMENSVLNYKSPLYGRRTGQMLLKPFRFESLNGFFGDRYSFEELLKIWGTLDGIPLYLKQFDKSLTYYENVKSKLFDPGEILFSEAEFLLNEELREPRNYFAILRAISLGKRKLGEIINETGIDKSSIMKYISVLNMLHIVEKEVPLGEDPHKSKKGLYKICDNYFRFYFRYIFYYKDLLSLGQVERVMSLLRKTENHFFSFTYENLAQSLLNKMVEGYAIYPESGRWWDRNVEIDVIGINREENKIIFGEVKWTEKPVGSNILRALIEKSNKKIWEKFSDRSYILFSKSGFTKELIEMARRDKNIFLVHGAEQQ